MMYPVIPALLECVLFAVDSSVFIYLWEKKLEVSRKNLKVLFF